VLPVGSFGSAVSAPTEFCSIPGVRYFHFAFDDSASSVRQTPPPEAPAQRRQLPGTQVGAMIIAGVLVAVALVAPEKPSTPGWSAVVLGPWSSQLPPPAFLPEPCLIFSKVASAFWETASGITLAG
jgi:hypothetical protein